jgi:hypothetical protein
MNATGCNRGANRLVLQLLFYPQSDRIACRAITKVRLSKTEAGAIHTNVPLVTQSCSSAGEFPFNAPISNSRQHARHLEIQSISDKECASKVQRTRYAGSGSRKSITPQLRCDKYVSGLHWKKRPTMHNANSRPLSVAVQQPNQAEIVYRGLTLAAIVLLLASLWVF